MITAAANVLAGIAWDPQIRGLLILVVGIGVLMGSVYLLLGTNLGHRLGFLVALSGLFGWMTILGFYWWINPSTTGPAGRPPSWKVIEVNYGDLSQANLKVADTLDVEKAKAAGLPPTEKLADMTPDQIEKLKKKLEPATKPWKLVAESDKAFGESKAGVDAELANGTYVSLNAQDVIDSTDDYKVLYTFETGGKPHRDSDSNVDRIKNRISNTLTLTHPPHYLLMQMCPTKISTRAEAAKPGQAPPVPECDPNGKTISVIMERDIGWRRLPAALVTLSCGTMFGLLCYTLHIRDRRLAQHLAAPLPVPAKV